MSHQKSYLSTGAAIGFCSFVLAELVPPVWSSYASEHDSVLTQRLSLIYCISAASFFAANLAGRASAQWKGLVIGSLAGAAFQILCTWNVPFFNMLLLFPAVSSALISVLLPITLCQSSETMTVLRRCSNGLIAGFALGAIHEILLNIVLGCISIIGLMQFHVMSEPEYLSYLSYVGPVAFAPASAAYFLLMHKILRERQPLNSSVSRECARLFAVIVVLTICVNWKDILGHFR